MLSIFPLWLLFGVVLLYSEINSQSLEDTIVWIENNTFLENTIRMGKYGSGKYNLRTYNLRKYNLGKYSLETQFGEI